MQLITLLTLIPLIAAVPVPSGCDDPNIPKPPYCPRAVSDDAVPFVKVRALTEGDTDPGIPGRPWCDAITGEQGPCDPADPGCCQFDVGRGRPGDKRDDQQASPDAWGKRAEAVAESRAIPPAAKPAVVKRCNPLNWRPCPPEDEASDTEIATADATPDAWGKRDGVAGSGWIPPKGWQKREEDGDAGVLAWGKRAEDVAEPDAWGKRDEEMAEPDAWGKRDEVESAPVQTETEDAESCRPPHYLNCGSAGATTPDAWGKREEGQVEPEAWGKREKEEVNPQAWGKREGQQAEPDAWGKRQVCTPPPGPDAMPEAWGKREGGQIEPEAWGKRQGCLDSNVPDATPEAWGKRDEQDEAAPQAWGK